MVARNVSMRLKPNSVVDFSRVLEHEIIPVLRKQRGFQDEIAFVVPGGMEAVAISLWDSKENADAYGRTTYPEALRALAHVVEGIPQIQMYQVCNSTFHKVVLPVAV